MMLLADIDSKVEHPDHRYLLDFGWELSSEPMNATALWEIRSLPLWRSIQLIRSLFTGRRRQSFQFEPVAHGGFDASPPNGSIIAYSR